MTNPVSRILLAGLYDPESNLSMLRGCPHIMRLIWDMVTQYWKEMVEMPNKAEVDKRYEDGDINIGDMRSAYLFITPLRLRRIRGGYYSFPPPTDININMMPFIVGFTLEKSLLPEFVRPYWPMIEACLYPEMERSWHAMWPDNWAKSEIGKVNFLTIQESWVEPGTSQRRPGLHVDSPGRVRIQDTDQAVIEGKGSSRPYRGHPWGQGCAHRGKDRSVILRGGIYLASSLPSSCRAWNCRVAHDAVGR